jgi:hypothetical protein
MSRRLREELGTRGVLVLSALTLTVVAALAVVIANQDGPPPPVVPKPAPTPTVPTVKAVPPLQPLQRLTGTAANFDTSTGDWTGTGAAVAQVSMPAHSGSGALKLTATGGSMTAWAPLERAAGGNRYVGTGFVRAAGAPRDARALIRFTNADGSTDLETGQLVTDSTGAWTALPDVAAISPPGTKSIRLGVQVPAASPGVAQLFDDMSLEQTAGGSKPVVGPLFAVGSQILQANGKPLIMRGLQRFGLEGGTKTPLPTDGEIAQLKQWGANEVRISLGEQKWIATSCHYERGYPEAVDKIVQSVTSRGMVAMINLHFSALLPCGKPGLTPMADSPGSITFWQEVASRYRNNPLVAYDLFNEPNVSQSTWLDGGPITESDQTVQAAGMQQLYNAVRDAGAKNLVVISGLGYASRPPTELVQGANIAYGIHAYTCEASPPPSCTTPHPYDAATGPLANWLSFAKTHAVVVTEFGWPDGDNGTYNANVIAFAEAHHWGWSGFAWDGGTGGLFDLVQSKPAQVDPSVSVPDYATIGLSQGTIEPNAGGMPFVAAFARNAAARSAATKPAG